MVGLYSFIRGKNIVGTPAEDECARRDARDGSQGGGGTVCPQDAVV